MSNDFSAATGLTAEQIETYARNAVEARYDRSTHGVVACCAFQAGAEWQRGQNAPLPGRPDVGKAVVAWPSALHLDAAMDAWGEVSGNQRERMSAALYAAFRAHPPAASSAARVADLETALHYARLVIAAHVSEWHIDGVRILATLDAALSPAVPEPKS